MSVYLDASVLVALFSIDRFTNRATTFLSSRLPETVISDFAATEFASALARQVRIGHTTERLAQAAFAALDSWTATFADRVEIVPADVAMAERCLRRLDLPLRTGDALNIAIAIRVGATLATFDVKMRASAEVLGVRLEDV